MQEEGKKVLASRRLLSSFVFAVVCCLFGVFVLRVGMCERPPSPGSALMYLLAIHTSAMLAPSSQSYQCSTFTFLPCV